jgi:adenine-specific DNA-methyltransferase
VPVSNFAKVVRGIATGGNEFFVFDSEKAREHQIKDAYLLPTICKATDAKGPFFTQQHFETLVRNGRPAFLLNAASSQAPDQAVMHYLESGKEAGIHLRHLTAHRTPWYAF